MSGITKGSQYTASRSTFKSSNQRYSPLKSNKKSNRYSSNYRSKNKRRKGFGQFGQGLSPINWNKAVLLPFKKDFYNETSNTKSRQKQLIDEWKQQHDIECFHGYQETITKNQTTNNIPNPIMTFKDTNFPPIIMKAISNSGFENPTPIQSCTWPIILSGYNIIGIAKTGSGKTLAFLLPAVVHILSQPKVKRGDGPIAIVIAPTRELACQIEGEVDKFANNIKHCCVYGGAKAGPQQVNLERGVSIVIATPGRLLDFMCSQVTNLRRVTYCVIDEADRLLDMGFEPQLNAIMNQIRPDRQMMMFSATWPKEVRSLAKRYMVCNGDDSNVFQVAIGSMNRLRACEDVKQEVKIMYHGEKIEELKNILDRYNNCKILVFLATKRRVRDIDKQLSNAGYDVTCIHGNKNQNQRNKALNDFKTGEINIMLATNCVSRGIHVDNVSLVINFDFPREIEDYVHRIGRTGRAGNKGIAISFFVGDTDRYHGQGLCKVLRDAKQKVSKQLLQFDSSIVYGAKKHNSIWMKEYGNARGKRRKR